MRVFLIALGAFGLGFLLVSGLWFWAAPADAPAVEADPPAPQPAVAPALEVRLTSIEDAETGAAVAADVFVNDVLTCTAVTHCTFDLSGRGSVRVVAPGYAEWRVEMEGKADDQVLEGPVRLQPEEPLEPGISG